MSAKLDINEAAELERMSIRGVVYHGIHSKFLEMRCAMTDNKRIYTRAEIDSNVDAVLAELKSRFSFFGERIATFRFFAFSKEDRRAYDEDSLISLEEFYLKKVDEVFPNGSH